MADADKSLDLFEDDTPAVEQREVGGEAEGDTVTADPENRLMISKITCRDFKSYAGVKELGPFHKVTGMLS